jgi:nickel-dependent lactate racemase
LWISGHAARIIGWRIVRGKPDWLMTSGCPILADNDKLTETLDSSASRRPMPWLTERSPRITENRLQLLMERTIAEARFRIGPRPRRILLLPPDITRMHSGAGRLTEMLFKLLADDADVHVIPTLGQHVPHTRDDNRRMFGSIPAQRIHVHDWREGCVNVGEIPAEQVRGITAGAADWAIPISLSRMLMEGKWDLIVNIGHVVPHEVLGFANHNKNYFIGLGGKDTICASHMAAACCGIENNLGRLLTPLREILNLAESRFLAGLPDVYILLVTAQAAAAACENDEARPGSDGQQPASAAGTGDSSFLTATGLYVGDDLPTYTAAARHSREVNITLLDEPVQKVVCLMQGDEFHSTWVANKAIYRTRLALADGGELVIIAPGLRRFGEQPEVDALIRRHGYCGTPRVMKAYQQGAENGESESLYNYAHAAAHLINGSTEGRFRVTYAPGHLTQAEIENVGYEFATVESVVSRYRPQECRPGWNATDDGESFYFIPTPAAGLWTAKGRR